MRNFNKDIRNTQRYITGIWVLALVLTVVTIASGALLAYQLVNNPEAIGEFVGRIAKGFIRATQ